MCSNTSTPAKRARTESLDKATQQSPATPSSTARGQHLSTAIEGGHDTNRAVNTNTVLATHLSNCQKAIDAKDKIIADKDAEIDFLKKEHKFHLENIDALGGNEKLVEALSAESSRNSSQESRMSDSSQEAKKTTELKQEKKKERKDDEICRDDE